MYGKTRGERFGSKRGREGWGRSRGGGGKIEYERQLSGVTIGSMKR